MVTLTPNMAWYLRVIIPGCRPAACHPVHAISLQLELADKLGEHGPGRQGGGITASLSNWKHDGTCGRCCSLLGTAVK